MMGLALVAVMLLASAAGSAPIRPGAQPAECANSARSDTTWFGGYSIVGADYYAVPFALKSEAVWTFDRGIGPTGDPGRIEGGEGWAVVNLSASKQAFDPIPDEAGIADFDCYGAAVACLSNNVLEVHADSCAQGYHPADQFVRLESPICALGGAWEGAFLEYSGYWEVDEGMLFWRFGWRYYPAQGPDGDQWSDRVGSGTWFVVAGTDCLPGARASASPYVPSYAQEVIAVIDIAAFDPFGGPPIPTDFPGPLLDNLVVGVVGAAAPAGLDPAADHAGLRLSIRPNPATAGTSVLYRLERTADVRLEVVDAAGRCVRTLETGARPAGDRAARWDGRDADGRAVPAGVYWVRAEILGRSVTRSLVICR